MLKTPHSTHPQLDKTQPGQLPEEFGPHTGLLLMRLSLYLSFFPRFSFSLHNKSKHQIQQAGSDIFYVKRKKQQKNLKILKIPHSTHSSTRVWPATRRDWSEHWVVAFAAFFFFDFSFLFVFLVVHENQNAHKSPAFAILRFGNPYPVGSLGQLLTRSRPETRSSHSQKKAFLFVISTGSAFGRRLFLAFLSHCTRKFKTPKKIKTLKISSLPSFDSVVRITPAALDSCREV